MKTKRMFKFISITVSLLLLVVSLAGCNKKPVPSATQNQTTPAQTATGNGQNGDIDLGGMTVKIMYNEGINGKVTEAFAEGGYLEGVLSDRINNIQEDYNCIIEFVANGTNGKQYSNLHTSILTGKPTADIARINYWVFAQSIEKGGFYEVLGDYDDILELDNADLWDQNVTNDYLTIDGMTCAVQPAISGIELVYWGQLLFFNKSMLEREGIWDSYNLYDMQRAKTWTWAAFDEVASKLTKDTDGDGNTDQYGLIYNSRAHHSLNASNSNGSHYGFYEVGTDGKPVFRGREPGRLAVLNFLKDNGQKGKGWIYDGNFDNNVDQGPRDFFAAGHSGFIFEYGQEIETFKLAGMQDKLGALAAPIGPDNPNNDYYLSRENYKPWAICRNIADTEAAAQVLKALAVPLYTEEEEEIGIEATLADLIGGETEIIETFKMLGKRERAANNGESPFIATWANAIASYHGSFYVIVEQGFAPEQLNDMYADQIQTVINDYWNKVLEGAAKLKKRRQDKGLE